METFVKIVATLFVAMSFVIKVNSQGGCPAPPLPSGTNHTRRDIIVFSRDMDIFYSCSFGYVVIGPTTRTCNADGTWTGTDNVCRIDAASLVIACGAGLIAILVFIVLSCFLILRNRRAKRRAKRHLTIQREREGRRGLDGPGGTADGPGGATENPYQNDVPLKNHVERSDSGLAPDAEMEEIDLNNFEVESPIENNLPEIEEWNGI